MSAKILIVDDDQITPLIIEKYLKSHGYITTVANSAVEASQVMREEFFNLVITDINMPEINGLEFMLWIKQNFPACKVIIMTAFGSDEIKNFTKVNGAVNYFEKPVNLKELTKEVKNLLENKLSSTQEILLKDILQMIAVSGQKKVISVDEPIKGKTGHIYIKGIFPIHAEYGELYGEEAFKAILSEEQIMFFDLDWVDPPVKSIDKTVDILLSEIDKDSTKEVKVEPKPEEQSLVRAENKLLVRRKEQDKA
ncbi:MAG: response regulator, partial [Candidatus Sericytochromatia bacterium]